MIKLILKILLLLLLLLCSGCSVGWVRNGDMCYFIDDTPTPKQADARAACQTMLGDLAIIKSAEENEFIRNLVMQQNTTTPFGAWLGFKRVKADSKFYWHDETLVKEGYTNWEQGEPNNHQLYQQQEDCGNIYATTGTWNDFFCDFSLGNDQDGWTSDDSPVVLCQKPLLGDQFILNMAKL